VGKLAVNVGDRCIKLILFFETEAGAIEQERVASLIGMFRTQGSVIHIARLQLSGSYAGATYEIPTNLLSEQELELFELELSKLKLSAKPEQTKHDFELTHDDLETVSAGRIRFSPSPLDVKTSS
jgi:hypothetical protein